MGKESQEGSLNFDCGRRGFMLTSLVSIISLSDGTLSAENFCQRLKQILSRTQRRELLHSFPRRRSSHTWSEQSECLIIHSDWGDSFRLNEVAGTVWKFCDGQHSPYDMVQKVMEKFEVDKETCSEDTIDFLLFLKQKDLITL